MHCVVVSRDSEYRLDNTEPDTGTTYSKCLERRGFGGTIAVDSLADLELIFNPNAMNQYIKAITILVITTTIGIQAFCKPGIPVSNKMKTHSLSDDGQQFVRNEYIIQVNPQIKEIEIKLHTDFEEFSIVRFRKIKKLIYLIEVDNDPGLNAMTEHCRKLPYISRVQRNKIYRQIDKKKPLGKVE
jgi:hypothetical protein